MNVVWILNGCGMEADSITGGPVRFHEISRRWQFQPGAKRSPPKQRLMTTLGGERMLRRMGCELPVLRVPASLVLRHEPARVLRFWSYLLSALGGALRSRRMATVDTMITVSDYFCDIVPAMALKRQVPGRRWVAWIHHRELPAGERPGNRLINAATWRMQQWSLRCIARHADLAMLYDTAAGDLIAGELQALGMPDHRIRRMGNGIDFKAILRAEPMERYADAVMVGVRPNKGLHDIVPVWSELQRLRPGTTLHLMGGMSGIGALRSRIRAAGLENVISLRQPIGAYLPSDTYYRAIKGTGVLFAPSHEEGWGIAVCEAMGAGLPVVAYDLPVYRRIFDRAYEPVPCFDTATFARRLAGVLDNPLRNRRLRQAGLLQAARYDWDRIAQEDFDSLLAMVKT